MQLVSRIKLAELIIYEIIEKFKDMTKTECVRINTEGGETSPFESSFGGMT